MHFLAEQPLTVRLIHFQIAGKHFVVYEAYYKQVSVLDGIECRKCHSPVHFQIDPKDVGRIEAMQAANFLKKSGLSVVVLSRVSKAEEEKLRK